MQSDWHRLRLAFRALSKRTKPLRAYHQAAGWGAAERALIDRLASSDPREPAVQAWNAYRPQLEAAAAAPSWLLAGGDPHAAREFQTLADRGATLVGHTGPDGWLAWCDRLLEQPLADGRQTFDGSGGPQTLIPDVLESSVIFCRLFEAALSIDPTTTAPATPLVDPAEDQPSVTTERRARFARVQRAVLAATGQKLTHKAFVRFAGSASGDTTTFRHWLNESQDAKKLPHQSRRTLERAVQTLERNPKAIAG